MQRSLDDLAKKQLPFAMALAATSLAKRVQAEETAGLSETFDKPTPFTQKAFAIKAATKKSLAALVFAKDIQAEYLQPYLSGGRQQLRGKRGLPVPVDIRTNQYGNLPKGSLARLKGRADVFFGQIRTKQGRLISGVWQRPSAKAARPARRAAKGTKGAARPTGGLKLLIEWTGGVEVKQRLGYRERAARIINRFAAAELSRAMARAKVTARR